MIEAKWSFSRPNSMLVTVHFCNKLNKLSKSEKVELK